MTLVRQARPVLAFLHNLRLFTLGYPRRLVRSSHLNELPSCFARDTMSMSSKPTDAGTEITPVSRCRTTVKLISQGLRRISARVVNIAGTSLEDEGHVRLRSDDGAERVAEGGERLEAVGEPLLGPSSVLRSPVRTHTRILGADKSLLARDLQFSDIPVRGFVLFFLLGPCSVPYCRTGGPKLPFFVRSFFTPFC